MLMTNGWDRGARERAAEAFGLDHAELEERSHLASAPFEEGRLGLDAFLDLTVFHRPRPFSRERFRRFMLAQSRPFAGMLELIAGIKRRHGLRVAVLSNEGRELNAHRVRLGGLDRLADAFVSSSFVGLRKPDPAIYRLALDLVQTPPGRTLYVDNTAAYLPVARSLGLRCLLHRDEASTRAALAAQGLS